MEKTNKKVVIKRSTDSEFQEEDYLTFSQVAEDMTDVQLMAEVMTRFRPEYQHPNEEHGDKNSRYKPRYDSDFHKGLYQNGYYVTYAFPHGSRTPVVSFWTKSKGNDGKERFNFFHIDLGRIVKGLLALHGSMGYLPPNPEKDRNYGIEEDFKSSGNDESDHENF